MTRTDVRRAGRSYAESTTPRIGAIRWDAWFGPSTFNTAGAAVETSLGPAAWRYRLPFFGTEINATTITARGNTQQTVDQEILYARQAGLHYWAFVAYQPPDHLELDHLTYGLNLYRAAANKHGLGYALILAQLGAVADWAATAAKWATMMTEPAYVHVVGGRPLVYLFDAAFTDAALAASHIATLRSTAVAAGAGNPYIAVMGTPAAAAALHDTVAADAISGYSWQNSDTPGVLTNRAYSTLAAFNLTQRDAALATGKKVIPCINEGWDKRPRYDNPPPWEPGLQPNVWYTRATAAEFASNVRDAVDWTRLNRGACEAETLIIYAWNEVDEGGWMTPPNASFGSEGTARLDALRATLAGRRIAV